MKTEIRITTNFKKEDKSLIKKLPSLVAELEQLQNQLLATPNLGKPLGNSAYKIRLSIKSKEKGKSGGGRVITFLETELLGLVEIENKIQIEI